MNGLIKKFAAILAVAILGLSIAGSRAEAVTIPLSDGSFENGTVQLGANASYTTVTYTPTTLMDIVVSVTVNGLGAGDLAKVLWGINTAATNFIQAFPASTGTNGISFTSSTPFTIAFATQSVSKQLSFTWAVSSSVPAVPLPAGGLLLLTGLGGLALTRRRKA